MKHYSNSWIESNVLFLNEFYKLYDCGDWTRGNLVIGSDADHCTIDW